MYIEKKEESNIIKPFYIKLDYSKTFSKQDKQIFILAFNIKYSAF
jgi:hypothetical protein